MKLNGIMNINMVEGNLMLTISKCNKLDIDYNKYQSTHPFIEEGNNIEVSEQEFILVPAHIVLNKVIEKL